MRESYVRACATDEERGVEATVGVEMRDGDDVDEMGNVLRMVVGSCLAHHGGNHPLVAGLIEYWVKRECPCVATPSTGDSGGKGTCQ